MRNSISFSRWYDKLNNSHFTTIRRYDKYPHGTYLVLTPSRGFYAELYHKEKLMLKEIPTEFLLQDTDCESREEAIQLLCELYKKPISEEERFTILYFRKI